MPRLLTAGEDFNSRLNKLLEAAKAEGYNVLLYYAFDRWGIRKIPPDQWKGLNPTDTALQNTILDALDKTNKQQIDAITESWKRAFQSGKGNRHSSGSIQFRERDYATEAK